MGGPGVESLPDDRVFTIAENGLTIGDAGRVSERRLEKRLQVVFWPRRHDGADHLVQVEVLKVGRPRRVYTPVRVFIALEENAGPCGIQADISVKLLARHHKNTHLSAVGVISRFRPAPCAERANTMTCHFPFCLIVPDTSSVGNRHGGSDAPAIMAVISRPWSWP